MDKNEIPKIWEDMILKEIGNKPLYISDPLKIKISLKEKLKYKLVHLMEYLIEKIIGE